MQRVQLQYMHLNVKYISNLYKGFWFELRSIFCSHICFIVDMKSEMTGDPTKIDYVTFNNKYGKYIIKFEYKKWSLFVLYKVYKQKCWKMGIFLKALYNRKQVHFKISRSINLDLWSDTDFLWCLVLDRLIPVQLVELIFHKLDIYNKDNYLLDASFCNDSFWKKTTKTTFISFSFCMHKYSEMVYLVFTFWTRSNLYRNLMLIKAKMNKNKFEKCTLCEWESKWNDLCLYRVNIFM